MNIGVKVNRWAFYFHHFIQDENIVDEHMISNKIYV